MSWLLDTNVVSEIMRPRPDANVVEWLRNIPAHEAYISVITIAEARRGASRMAAGRRRTELETWIDHELPVRFDGRIIDVSVEVADAWGELMSGAERKGISLHPMDGFVAATASVHSMVLVSRNTKDFVRLGLELKDPWRS